jgi:hypothetical protein
MKKALLAVGLLSILATSFAAVSSVNAQDAGDPVKRGCDRDARTIASNSAWVKGYELKVEMRWSPRCQARWVKAFIPKDTRLYIKDKFGRRYTTYVAQVNGWNYSNMVNARGTFQGCVQHPGDPREMCAR